MLAYHYHSNKHRQEENTHSKKSIKLLSSSPDFCPSGRSLFHLIFQHVTYDLLCHPMYSVVFPFVYIRLLTFIRYQLFTGVSFYFYPLASLVVRLIKDNLISSSSGEHHLHFSCWLYITHTSTIHHIMLWGGSTTQREGSGHCRPEGLRSHDTLSHCTSRSVLWSDCMCYRLVSMCGHFIIILTLDTLSMQRSESTGGLWDLFYFSTRCSRGCGICWQTMMDLHVV